MALRELDTARVRKVVGAYVESVRPAAHIRPKLDISFRIRNQSVEIVEIRPVWQGRPGEFMEHSVAKATYVRTANQWRVYWLRGSLKWQRYEPAPSVDTIEQFVELVREDAWSCFWG